jgi:phage tail-like protein
MSAPRLQTYRFASPKQWAAGLLERASVDDAGIVPLPRLGETSNSEYAHAAFCPAVSRRGELFWCDGEGYLHYRNPGAETPCELPAPSGIGGASRLIAWRSWLWALDRNSGVITRYFANTLQEAEAIGSDAFADPDAPGQLCTPVDIAPDGRDGLWVLAKGSRRPHLFRLDSKNSRPRPPSWPVNADPSVRAWSGNAKLLSTVRRGEIIVALVKDGSALDLIKATDGKIDRTVLLSDIVPDFNATALASNGTDRILLAGTGPQPFEQAVNAMDKPQKGPLLLAFDVEGDLVDQVKLAADDSVPPVERTLAALRDTVWVADGAGLHRLQPGAGGEGRPISVNFLTPKLISPDGKDRGWLRAEILADLPPGATLRVKYASTSDPVLMATITRILSDKTQPPNKRRQRVDQLLRTGWADVFEYRGAASPSPCAQGEPIASPVRTVPLYAAAGSALWLSVELRAAEPDQLPKLRELNLRYPNLSLMRHLPAIYRSKDGDRDGLLPSLVEVLQATTEGLQEKIEQLGTLVDPKTAPSEWLDFLATWLGMPWHEALAPEIKRSLLGAAGGLLGQRGTRAGLLQLLRCLLPGTRVRIVDSSVDLSPVILASNGHAGATHLPAVLLGRPQSYAVLGSPHAVLGRTHLKCADEVECPRDLIEGHLRIQIAAEAAQNAKVAAILPYLIRDYVPIGLRVDLRWRTADQAGFGRRLDEDFVLEGYRPAALDRRAVIGRTFLSPEGMGKLAPDGIADGFKLG